MAFNHYAKIKRILSTYKDWYIVRINEPTVSTKFNGEKVHYTHYYRIYDSYGKPIKFCKFQQIDRFSRALNIPIEDLPIVEIS